jgi:hypothetical protein
VGVYGNQTKEERKETKQERKKKTESEHDDRYNHKGFTKKKVSTFAMLYLILLLTDTNGRSTLVASLLNDLADFFSGALADRDHLRAHDTLFARFSWFGHILGCVGLVAGRE